MNLRGALVVAQVALSLALLISTGLFLRSLSYADKSISGSNRIMCWRFHSIWRFKVMTKPKAGDFTGRIVERVERLPGRAVGVHVTNILPLGLWRAPFACGSLKAGRFRRTKGHSGSFTVGPRYFETIGTPLIRGRDFTAQDTLNSKQVAVVSEVTPADCGPRSNDFGKTLRAQSGDDERFPVKSIGVAVTLKITSLIPSERAGRLRIPPVRPAPIAAASVVVRTSAIGNEINRRAARVAALD